MLIMLVFILQVSSPYKSTDFTVMLKSLILVSSFMSLEFHIFLSWMSWSSGFVPITISKEGEVLHLFQRCARVTGTAFVVFAFSTLICPLDV